MMRPISIPCNNKKCPVQKHQKKYCCSLSEIDPPCSEMDEKQLEELSEKLEDEYMEGV